MKGLVYAAATASCTHANKINNLFERESLAGRLYVKPREMDIPVEREWMISEEGEEYVVDLALPVEDGWLPVTFWGSSRPSRWATFLHRG